MSYQISWPALVKLSRWKEHLPFTIPITLLGALIAAYGNQTPMDWRLLAVIAGNILVVTYAFMINDIEDAPDDARDPDRAKRNPVSNGDISPNQGYVACVIVALMTMLCYALGGNQVLLVGMGALLASHLYSWRLIRLKGWPITDVTSHSLMLGGLLFLSAYFLYAPVLSLGGWLIFGAITLGSIHGQLHYQVRDYELDKLAGLRNTCIVIGKERTRLLMLVLAMLIFVFVATALLLQVIPYWVIGVGLAAVAIGLFFRPSRDMRGDSADEVSGKIQQGTLLMFNSITVAWLLQVLVL